MKTITVLFPSLPAHRARPDEHALTLIIEMSTTINKIKFRVDEPGRPPCHVLGQLVDLMHRGDLRTVCAGRGDLSPLVGPGTDGLDELRHPLEGQAILQIVSRESLLPILIMSDLPLHPP